MCVFLTAPVPSRTRLRLHCSGKRRDFFPVWDHRLPTQLHHPQPRPGAELTSAGAAPRSYSTEKKGVSFKKRKGKRRLWPEGPTSAGSSAWSSVSPAPQSCNSRQTGHEAEKAASPKLRKLEIFIYIL